MKCHGTLVKNHWSSCPRHSTRKCQWPGPRTLLLELDFTKWEITITMKDRLWTQIYFHETVIILLGCTAFQNGTFGKMCILLYILLSDFYSLILFQCYNIVLPVGMWSKTSIFFSGMKSKYFCKITFFAKRVSSPSVSTSEVIFV